MPWWLSSEVPKGGGSLEGEGEGNAGLGARLQERLLPAEEAERQEWGSKIWARERTLLCSGLREGADRAPGCDRQRALRTQARRPESAVCACVSGAGREEPQESGEAARGRRDLWFGAAGVWGRG